MVRLVVFHVTHWAFVIQDFGVILVSLKNIQCLYQKRTSYYLVCIRNQLDVDVTFVLSFIFPVRVAQHVSGNYVPIFRS